MSRPLTATLVAALVACVCSAAPARAEEGFTKRIISYQNKKDLFYNVYEGPDPSGLTAGAYVSPRPVPPNVGHTYTTYQPYMPHEYMYRHTRSHYAYQQGAGWSRAKIRYRTYGLRLDDLAFRLSGPRY